MSDAQVQFEVMGVLRTMFPKVAIPEPTAFLFTRWFNDPLYRGSYSTWAPTFVSQHLINLGAPVGRVFFAGEATSVRYFGMLLFFICSETSVIYVLIRLVAGSLHGAYFEGQAAGAQIVRCIKGQQCYPQTPIFNIQSTFPYSL